VAAVARDQPAMEQEGHAPTPRKCVSVVQHCCLLITHTCVALPRPESPTHSHQPEQAWCHIQQHNRVSPSTQDAWQTVADPPCYNLSSARQRDTVCGAHTHTDMCISPFPPWPPSLLLPLHRCVRGPPTVRRRARSFSVWSAYARWHQMARRCSATSAWVRPGEGGSLLTRRGLHTPKGRGEGDRGEVSLGET
jgi:hypothetical protein